MTPDEQIHAAQRVKTFVEDPAIVQAFAALEAKHYSEFLAAKTRDGVDKAHSRAVVLAELRTELQAIVDRGETETRKRDREQRSTSTPRVR